MTYRPSPHEDYLRGSSDNPLSGLACANTSDKQYSLGKKLEQFGIKHLTSDRTLDVGKTNRARLDFAKRNLPPYAKVSGSTRYRSVGFDDDGLLIVSYLSLVPEKIGHLSDRETVSAGIAAQLLKMTESEVLQLVKSRALDGRGKKVNLRNLNEYKDSKNMTKILLVEDQKYPLEALEHALRTVTPRYFPQFSHAVAKCYDEAEEQIEQDIFDIVLLDHRMPRRNQGDLEERDMKAFGETCEGIGYSLIEPIRRRSPRTVVIGTSSMSGDELRGQPSPDYTMSKMWGSAERDLDKIFTELSKKSGEAK